MDLVYILLLVIVAIASSVLAVMITKRNLKKSPDGFLDIIEQPEGDPALLLEINEWTAINKTYVVLKTRRSGRFTWEDDSQEKQAV